ncbi:phosphate/phosphite/phosphonate ABC transporter substrate-binding protein [Glaciecola sp. MH2013]|uniref:phosphate/phosphite/phosphonate ABC transporter substrate-binding protein n=1 Tax=Glaciecola sp. MH2013 TaxID=2785524 RepID=UPI0018A0A3A1|nr:phosphate/phosphite/phosphonate ABC transporter substrate-binding protein [Glaciecola sp. MH2013]MBF7073502.1 phosphate/phosphite/phosphonate ABC transporter substrate-binding protein [Glaciecola sp. MH2013]
MTRGLLCLVFLCSFILPIKAQQQSEAAVDKKRQLSFGVVPQQSPTRLASKWGPVLRRLSAETNIEIKFATAKNIPTFEARLAAGEYDLAYMNPYHYVHFSSSESGAYRAIAKESNKALRGIIVALASSDLASLEQLRNQEIAFPAPASFAASIIPQKIFENAAIAIQPKYVFSHDSVYLNVARGFVPAGGGVMRTFNAAPEHIRKNLKVIWTSDSYTPHAIAAHRRVSDEDIANIMQAFLTLNQDESFQKLLNELKFNPFEAATDNDWDDIRHLGISGFLAPSATN